MQATSSLVILAGFIIIGDSFPVYSKLVLELITQIRDHPRPNPILIEHFQQVQGFAGKHDFLSWIQ
jgi:hypothetical protein